MFGKTTTWAYDNNGNILVKKEYDLTAKPTKELRLLAPTACKLYTYQNNSDQLVSYDGDSFDYDDIGNPDIYRGTTARWDKGRQLIELGNHSFSYDARGRRTNKDNITFTYDSDGNLIRQSDDVEAMVFLYDHTGVFAVKYDNATYYYRKDAQGNVIALLDNSGAVVVKYVYDAWGNCKAFDALGAEITEATHATHIGYLNPFRYRGYYYDVETKLYFLQTRYYDPEIGRFISPDSVDYLDPTSINGLNLYAYCNDDPVDYCDPSGHFAILACILGITALIGMGLTIGGVASDNNLITGIGLTMVAVPALISGIGAIAAGIGGATLTGIVGGVTVIAGVGSGLFASAEFQESLGNGNWIQDTTGMSDALYNTLLISIAAIATLGTFASNVGSAFKIKSIDHIGKLVPSNHPNEGYFGVRFRNARGSLQSLEIQNHAPHGLHFQLNSWNPKWMSVTTKRRWTWYLTSML